MSVPEGDGRDFMFRVKSSPDPGPLRELIARLEGHGLVCALGGSGLLLALGLTDAVRDWDLTVDAPARLVHPLLDPDSARYVGSDALHADEKLELPASRIEIICRFAFYTKAGIVTLPTRVWERRDGIPLASPEVWAVAYALLDRREKHQRMMDWLAVHGADPEVVAALRAQPLPEALGARLATLRPAGTSRTT